MSGLSGSSRASKARPRCSAANFRTIHDLLYRPQLAQDEQAFESILANLAAVYREFGHLLECAPARHPRPSTLDATLRRMKSLASEICGDCVPREYAGELKGWMDRNQELSRLIA
jgi:hypothetical protein